MTIREIVESDRGHWVRLREALWPGSLSDHDDETRRYFERQPKAPVVFVAEAKGRLVGFLELDYRKYAPGCRSSPVAFIEGWYVEPDLQGQGIGRALIEAAEARVAVVTLDRVVCCYPDYAPLLAEAVRHSELRLALSYPRDLWYVRAVVALENTVRRLIKNPFRTFVHPAAAMERLIRDTGFRLVRRRGTIAWCVDVYLRAGAV